MRKKLTCKTLDEVEADLFIDNEHRQGALSRKKKTKNLGLYADGELVGVLQVGPPRTKKMIEIYSLEIYRLAFKGKARFPGGASKLVKNYIRLFNPADLFTYQDTTGDNSQVYKHSGMTLIEDGLRTKKSYLIAPGKTLKTASRKEALGMAYAVRYGPDRILGTSLGEIFDTKTGKRKTNQQIFLDNLGWHIETTTGDSLWEWVAPDRTYYTYKITASDSDKYYYGVSHIKKTGASLQECAQDGYFGSGGKKQAKYSNWKRKHEASLKKEVLQLFTRKVEAYNAEKICVGDLYRTDPLCLNSVAGGMLQPHVAGRLLLALCEVHGETKHNGSACLKCVSQKAHTVGICPMHGSSSFFGGQCQRCVSSATKKVGICPVHGSTKFQGLTCYKCMSESKLSVCKRHGESKFYGGRCMACSNMEKVTLAHCEVHKEVKHIGGRCYVCISSASVSIKSCPIHGETKHRGKSCFKCRSTTQTVSDAVCPVHGETKHNKEKCVKCNHAKMIRLALCPIHGESKHRGTACFKCSAAKRKKA